VPPSGDASDTFTSVGDQFMMSGRSDHAAALSVPLAQNSAARKQLIWRRKTRCEWTAVLNEACISVSVCVSVCVCNRCSRSRSPVTIADNCCAILSEDTTRSLVNSSTQFITCLLPCAHRDDNLFTWYSYPTKYKSSSGDEIPERYVTSFFICLLVDH